jgi:hypothetical protein
LDLKEKKQSGNGNAKGRSSFMTSAERQFHGDEMKCNRERYRIQ